MRLTTEEQLRTLLGDTRSIAVVGVSDKPWRASYQVIDYLRDAGYHVIPVNPRLQSVLGLRCYPDLVSVPEPIDMVDVFRRADEVGPVVTQALAVGARSIWFQLGVVNPEEAERASAGGLQVVMDLCTKIEHARLIGWR